MEWGVKAANPCIRATLGMHLFWSTVLVPASRGLPNIPGIIIFKKLVHCLLLIQLNLGYRLKQHQPRHCETPCWVAFFSERCCKIGGPDPPPFGEGGGTKNDEFALPTAQIFLEEVRTGSQSPALINNGLRSLQEMC